MARENQIFDIFRVNETFLDEESESVKSLKIIPDLIFWLCEVSVHSLEWKFQQEF